MYDFNNLPKKEAGHNVRLLSKNQFSSISTR